MTHPMESFVRPGLATAAPYDARHHDDAWQHRELDRLMSNECPLPPSEAILDVATGAMGLANLYPHSGEDFREALARFVGVRPENIMLGNGSTEVLDVVTRTLVGAGDETIIPTPTYAFFETQTRVNLGKPLFVPLTDTWALDVPSILAAITPRTKAIFLCSPNNPTGNSWSRDQLRALLEAGIPTVVDQAYLECGYSESFAPLVESYSNLVVTRTMSKGFGLAGLRIGYAIADPWFIDVLLRVRIPFSLSLMALWVGLAAVKDPGELDRHRRFISGERDRLYARLLEMPGVKPFPSDANFLLIDMSATGVTAVDAVDAARKEGVLIRPMTAHRLQGSHVRVTVGTTDQNDRFLAVFRRLLGLDLVVEPSGV